MNFTPIYLLIAAGFLVIKYLERLIFHLQKYTHSINLRKRARARSVFCMAPVVFDRVLFPNYAYYKNKIGDDYMEENGQINTNAVVSLTMGILSLLFFPFIGWILGIIGLVYSNRSLREIEDTQEKGKNLAVAGKVCSIGGIVLSLVSIIIVIGGLALFSIRIS